MTFLWQRSMLSDLLIGFLGGLFGDRLAKLVPPRKASEFDVIGEAGLNQRNHWIEIVSSIIFWGGLLVNYLVLTSIGLNGNAWRIVFLFCSPMALTLLFIYSVTLPKGIRRVSEFWRYHELKHRTRFGLLMSMYALIATIGLVSTFFSFADPSG